MVANIQYLICFRHCPENMKYIVSFSGRRVSYLWQHFFVLTGHLGSFSHFYHGVSSSHCSGTECGVLLCVLINLKNSALSLGKLAINGGSVPDT